ncbi:MAG: class I SAM-dependent methyltransferase [Gemmatimonadetes bacterium]|nr:class I SAM-dependent methyltransferase [Gemmatimonadota bacterium]
MPGNGGLSGLLARLRSDPLGVLGRVFAKLVIGPVRYGRRGGYDAERYWRDRFAKHGRSLRAVGHEGLSEEVNREMYRQAATTFGSVCASEKLDLESARVLDIGCGTGFYTALCRDLGVQQYVGVDITDVFFPDLRREFPGYSFHRRDITRDVLRGEFDLIVMIDLAEHIVEPDRLTFALENVKRCLAPEGVFAIALPHSETRRRELFYVRFWSLDDIRDRFAGFAITDPVPFRYGSLLTIRRRHPV